MKLQLKIKREECKGKCPIPLHLIPNVEQTIKRINYDEKREEGEITYDEKRISEEQIIQKLKKMGYKVKK